MMLDIAGLESTAYLCKNETRQSMTSYFSFVMKRTKYIYFFYILNKIINLLMALNGIRPVSILEIIRPVLVLSDCQTTALEQYFSTFVRLLPDKFFF
jgi:hypothetical protein